MLFSYNCYLLAYMSGFVSDTKKAQRSYEELDEG
jgi:hypothetical protein